MESWKPAGSEQNDQVQPSEGQTFTDPFLWKSKSAVTKHIQILEELLMKAEGDQNTLGFLVFGSVASGTHHEKSDIDVITILRGHNPSSGINKTVVDGIIVDSLFLTHEVLTQSVGTVPYLLHTLVDAKILLDRENAIRPLIEEVREYFAENPEIESEWNRFFKESKEVKLRTGCRAQGGNTIIDVWNELEKRYSGGRVKRPFFNSFYLTNPHLFSLVKKFLK
jgi:predicted nucleotidyltransferase